MGVNFTRKANPYTKFVGCKFHKLTLMEVYDIGSNPARRGLFKCECGNLLESIIKNVIRETRPTTSCGCSKIKYVKKSKNKLRLSNLNEYNSWRSMIVRCFDPKNKDYHKYGGKGIVVCDRWRSFENFLEDMGKRPKGTTLDRMDNSLGYSPDNCRWADARTQTLNRRKTLYVTAFGETLPATIFAEKYGIEYGCLKYNIYANKDLEQLVLKHRNN